MSDEDLLNDLLRAHISTEPQNRAPGKGNDGRPWLQDQPRFEQKATKETETCRPCGGAFNPEGIGSLSPGLRAERYPG
jgi:hypothetical protein